MWWVGAIYIVRVIILFFVLFEVTLNLHFFNFISSSLSMSLFCFDLIFFVWWIVFSLCKRLIYYIELNLSSLNFLLQLCNLTCPTKTNWFHLQASSAKELWFILPMIICFFCMSDSMDHLFSLTVLVVFFLFGFAKINSFLLFSLLLLFVCTSLNFNIVFFDSFFSCSSSLTHLIVFWFQLEFLICFVFKTLCVLFELKSWKEMCAILHMDQSCFLWLILFNLIHDQHNFFPTSFILVFYHLTT